MLQPVEILVLEDYEPDAHFLQLMLKRNHITNPVRVIGDGRSGLDFIFGLGEYKDRAAETLPGVVIMDIRLPKMDGWSVLRHLRQDPRTRELPVIMTSGSLFDKELETATQLGANACLPKPIEIEALRAALKKCGFFWTIVES